MEMNYHMGCLTKDITNFFDNFNLNNYNFFVDNSI